MTPKLTIKLMDDIATLKKQVETQAEAITARNIKILKLERQIAAMERREGK